MLDASIAFVLEANEKLMRQVLPVMAVPPAVVVSFGLLQLLLSLISLSMLPLEQQGHPKHDDQLLGLC